MGKVGSFFRVLGCPKSKSARDVRKSRMVRRVTPVEEHPSGSLGVDTADDPCTDIPDLKLPGLGSPSIEIPVEESEPPSSFRGESMSVADVTDNKRDIALLALSNTLVLKLKHSALLAFVALQKHTLRAHLCRYFVKKTLFILSRHQDECTRDALITLRQHRSPHKLGSFLPISIATIETNLSKLYRRNALIALLALGRRKDTDRKERSTVRQNHRSEVDGSIGCNRGSSERPGGSKSSLADGRSIVGLDEVAKPRSSTVGPLQCYGSGAPSKELYVAKSQQLEQAQRSSVPTQSIGANPIASANPAPLLLKAGSNTTVEASRHAPPQKADAKPSGADLVAKEKLLIGNRIYQNAIKKVATTRPTVSPPLTNIVYQLDFFTCEPYVSILRGINFTPNAVERLRLLATKCGDKSLVVSVTGGGCSGFQYHFNLVDDTEALRCIYDGEGCVKVFSDDASLELIATCSVDYQRNLVGSKFVLDNIKNVSKRCSCGNSFDIKE